MRNALPPLFFLALAACAVGPDYEKPDASVPAAYKENGGWKPAEPMDALDRDGWWKIYNDPILNALESQVALSNQTIKEYEAAYRAAVATADQTRAGLFPSVDIAKSSTRSGTGARKAASVYDLSANGSWTIDLWGKIRRQLESDDANAQVSDADLANARLSAQAELATDYFALRTQDETQKMLDQTVTDNEKIAAIIGNQYKAGTASASDLASADAQVDSARATAVAAQLTRAELEHAVAVLVGRSPSDFSLPPNTSTPSIPVIPAGLPSALLERRPDIAAAERATAAANAEIGVAEAAFFPELTLSASYGFSSAALDKLFNAASTAWSWGGSATGNAIDFGARRAATEEARANFDKAVATYRQTVLTAFQSVEDNLAAQRLLADQEKAAAAAANQARKAEQVALNQYKEGLVPYNTVLTAQTARLADEQNALSVRNSRLAASVALIEALGGGWDRHAL